MFLVQNTQNQTKIMTALLHKLHITISKMSDLCEDLWYVLTEMVFLVWNATQCV